MKAYSRVHSWEGLIRIGFISIAILAFLIGSRANASDIAPGNDVWATPTGGAFHDFSDSPIPADFFEPGSQPFGGTVQLEGAGTGCFDTVIRRLDPASPLPVGASVDIAVEIVELSLVSSAPIQVAPQNDPWDVQVDLSQIVPQPGGIMTINHQYADSGTYSSSQGICPRMTFQRLVSPFDIRVIDVCNDLGDVVIIETDNKIWSHNVQLPLVCPNSSPDFRPQGPHTGPHPGAIPVESLVPGVPGLTRYGVGTAVLALVGAFAVLRRRSSRV